MRLATMHWTSSMSISVSPKNCKDLSNAFSGSWWVPKRRYLTEEGERKGMVSSSDDMFPVKPWSKRSKKCFSDRADFLPLPATIATTPFPLPPSPPPLLFFFLIAKSFLSTLLALSQSPNQTLCYLLLSSSLHPPSYLPPIPLCCLLLGFEPRLSIPNFASQLWGKIDFSPKLQDKIRNEKPGFEATSSSSFPVCYLLPFHFTTSPPPPPPPLTLSWRDFCMQWSSASPGWGRSGNGWKTPVQKKVYTPTFTENQGHINQTLQLFIQHSLKYNENDKSKNGKPYKEYAVYEL